jgi:cytochrome b involved in lipid metabolism
MIPFLNFIEIKKLVENDRKLLISNNYVYDVSDYYKKHPGGNCILKKIVKLDCKLNRLIIDDCSIDFNFHSKNAKNIWKDLLIGTIKRHNFWQTILVYFNLN